MRDINEIMQKNTRKLMAISGIIGVGVGQLEDSTPCIKVMVVKKTPELEKKIPKKLKGHPVEIHETGKIRAL